jgi:hypothetical protein
MQCLTGAAGENNVPSDFCETQLSKQRSMNWAVLPDKPSSIDGSVRPFAVIITIRGRTIDIESIRIRIVTIDIRLSNLKLNFTIELIRRGFVAIRYYS